MGVAKLDDDSSLCVVNIPAAVARISGHPPTEFTEDPLDQTASRRLACPSTARQFLSKALRSVNANLVQLHLRRRLIDRG
jgi:hypothetical protein